MPTNWKTSEADARALATKWYGLLGRAPDAQGLQHWIQQIQQDGSNTAWQNFANSPEPKAANVTQKAQQAGFNPIELNPGQGQLPGTNTKNVSGFANEHPWLRTAARALPMTGGALNFIPGAETPMGALLKEGGNIGDAARQEAKYGAAAVAGGALGGIGGAAGGASGAASSLPGITSIAGLLGKIPGIGGTLSGAADFLGGNSGMNALGVAQGINAANLGAKSTQWAQKAADTATGNWNANAPLRDAGRSGMLNAHAPDLSGLDAIRGANPFSRPMAPAGPPSGSPPLPTGTMPPPARPVSGPSDLTALGVRPAMSTGPQARFA